MLKKILIQSLEDAAADFIVPIVNENNCCEILLVSDRLHSIRVTTKVLEVMSVQFYSISQANLFSLLDVDLLEEVVRNDNLMVQTELDVLDAIIRWLVKHGHKIAISYSSTTEPAKTGTQIKQNLLRSL